MFANGDCIHRLSTIQNWMTEYLPISFLIRLGNVTVVGQNEIQVKMILT